MDGKYNFTTTDELNLYVTARIHDSLSNILKDYTKTGILDEAIKEELNKLSITIQKLKEKRMLKLKGIMSRTRKIILSKKHLTT